MKRLLIAAIIPTCLSAQVAITGVQGRGAKVQLSTGSTTTNNCVKFDANGNTVDAGTACGTGAVSSVTATAPLTSTGGATPVISGTYHGNGANIQRETGSTTTGNCASFDANGNVIDAGTTCGGGGGGSVNVNGVTCTVGGACTYLVTTAISFTQIAVDQGPRTYTPTVSGTVQYASPSGSGSGCTNINTPCTLAGAITAAAGGANKTIVMRGGTFTMGANLTLTASSLVFQAYPGETPVIDGVSTFYIICQSTNPITFTGITFANLASDVSDGVYSGIWFNSNGGPDPVATFTHDTFTNCINNCIWAQGATFTLTDNVFSNQIISNIGGFLNFATVQLIPNTGASVFSYNRCENVGFSCVMFNTSHGANNTVIDRNLIINAENLGASDIGCIYGQDTSGASTGTLVTNNYIEGCGGSTYAGNTVKAIYLDSDGMNGGQGTNNVTITGNFIRGCGEFCYQLHGSNHITISNNIHDITPNSTAQLGFYQSAGGSGGSSGGMGSNTFQHNIVYSKGAFPSNLWNVSLNGSDVVFATDATNDYYSANNSAIPLTTTAIVDSAPSFVNPEASMVTPLARRYIFYPAISQYPSISGCGTISGQAGNNLAGLFTTTTTGTCTAVITLPAAPNGYHCHATDQTKHVATNILLQSANSATSCTFVGTTAASDVIAWDAIPF